MRLGALGTTIIALGLLLTAIVRAQEDEPYLDDRSTAASVVESLYNAINRFEYSRAYSYFGDGPTVGDYKAWKAGYGDTQHVELKVGEASEEGAAGSIYYTLPVAIDAQSKSGKHKQFAGCYTLRLAQPAIQEPPFQGLHIERGELQPAQGELDTILPETCPGQ